MVLNNLQSLHDKVLCNMSWYSINLGSNWENGDIRGLSSHPGRTSWGFGDTMSASSSNNDT